MTYRELYQSWETDPEAFWMKAADHIDWDRAPSYALDARKAPFYEWYPDAMVNTCYNAVDRHVIAGKGAQAAIIYDSPITGQKTPSAMPICAINLPALPVRCAPRASPRATG